MSTVTTQPVRSARSTDAVAAGAQRRAVRALVAAQLTGGAGLASGITVAALIAVDLSGSAASSGLPEAAAVAGTAAAALPLALFMRRRGRRPGLRLGWSLGAVGALGVVAAAAMGSLPLLIGCMVLVGGANAASDAARHVAVDLATSATAGRAIGTVVAATAVSTALSPVLTGSMSGVARTLGLPPLTGPFLLSTVAFAAAAVVITVALRPDPLLLARRIAMDGAGEGGADGSARRGGRPARRLRSLLAQPDVTVAVAATAVATAAMLSLMTMTPLHLGSGGHSDHLGAVGTVISLHLAAMFAPSPLTGRLVDRIGGRTVIAFGGVLLAAAGSGAATAAPHQTATVAVSLVLLGLGWNACFVAGSSLLAAAVVAVERPRVQGAMDSIAGVAAMLGGAGSGVVAATAGYAALGAAVCALGVGLSGAVLGFSVTDHKRRPQPAAVPTGAGGKALPAGRRHRGLTSATGQ